MMNNSVSHNNDDAAEPAEVDDENATLADDVLDEVAGENEEEEDVIEGFGILPTKEEDAGEEEKPEDEEGDAELEDEDEDVEFDTFDDVDEL